MQNQIIINNFVQQNICYALLSLKTLSPNIFYIQNPLQFNNKYISLLVSSEETQGILLCIFKLQTQIF
ncbi:unnamed protein product [Paramecium octaurelia]|uniref:Uncharacterized protein n=1 Tax=Paramecium octaurelia TaxID=43137 RepID=A0A8S1W5N2_PAROT|nr:unnamed protein product [Paramecium octaurelia]